MDRKPCYTFFGVFPENQEMLKRIHQNCLNSAYSRKTKGHDSNFKERENTFTQNHHFSTNVSKCECKCKIFQAKTFFTE